ncbi:uncharacterized, partial [Tachysurus ichikawai]
GGEKGWVGGGGNGEGGQLWPVRGEWWKLGDRGMKKERPKRPKERIGM